MDPSEAKIYPWELIHYPSEVFHGPPEAEKCWRIAFIKLAPRLSKLAPCLLKLAPCLHKAGTMPFKAGAMLLKADAMPSLRGCEEIQSGPRCGRDEASREARRRGDAGTSRRRRNEADGLVPPATLRAGGGCGAICASLVVNDVITSPPPRSSISPRKLHQRGPLWISSQPPRMTRTIRGTFLMRGHSSL